MNYREQMRLYSRRNINHDVVINSNKVKKISQTYNANVKISQIFQDKCWAEKRVFIIGGGTSLQGFDFNLLKNEVTLGINKAFEHCSFLTANYSMDVRFYLDIKARKLEEYAKIEVFERWRAFTGVRIFLTPIAFQQFGNDVCLVRRCDVREIKHSIDQGIYAGHNSATGALMLAATLGAKKIYLLGYDMKTANGKTHWHEGYANRDVGLFEAKLRSYTEELNLVSPLLALKGIKVINLNRDSALKAFAFGDLETVLKE